MSDETRPVTEIVRDVEELPSDDGWAPPPVPTPPTLRRIVQLLGGVVLGVVVVVGILIVGSGLDADGAAGPIASESASPLASADQSGSSATPGPSSSVKPSNAATPRPSPTAAPATGWTPVEIAGIGWLHGIAERDGRLLAAGTNADGDEAAMATSDDGETWTPVDLSTLNRFAGFFSVGSGELGFISVGARYPVPMGMPELSYLYSHDGRTWHQAVPPEDCFAGSISPYGEGFIGLGGRCRSEGDFEPSELLVITSSDGRSWSSRISNEMSADSWATDGHRLVLFQRDQTGQAPAQIWMSDDAAMSWHLTGAFPAGVSVGNPVYGHGRYLAPASWLAGEGDPGSAVCVSANGENWDCSAIPPLNGELAGRHWVYDPVATPTGYVSLAAYTSDPFFGGDGSTDIVAATSVDGVRWTFEVVPELGNTYPQRVVWTSHGLVAWGGSNPNLQPEDVSAPFIVVHRAALP